MSVGGDTGAHESISRKLRKPCTRGPSHPSRPNYLLFVHHITKCWGLLNHSNIILTIIICLLISSGNRFTVGETYNTGEIYSRPHNGCHVISASKSVCGKVGNFQPYGPRDRDEFHVRWFVYGDGLYYDVSPSLMFIIVYKYIYFPHQNVSSYCKESWCFVKQP